MIECLCGAEFRSSIGSRKLYEDGSELVIKNIPCYVCPDCGKMIFAGPVILKISSYVNDLNCTAIESAVIDFGKIPEEYGV